MLRPNGAWRNSPKLWCVLTRTYKKGQEAIPIFHNVDPLDLRWQRNSVAKELAKHEADLKGSDLGKVQRWKNALCKAANIAGWDVGKIANRNEAECIDQIINEKFHNLRHTVSANEKYLVGIESHTGGVESLLKV